MLPAQATCSTAPPAAPDPAPVSIGSACAANRPERDAGELRDAEVEPARDAGADAGPERDARPTLPERCGSEHMIFMDELGREAFCVCVAQSGDDASGDGTPEAPVQRLARRGRRDGGLAPTLSAADPAPRFGRQRPVDHGRDDGHAPAARADVDRSGVAPRRRPRRAARQGVVALSARAAGVTAVEARRGVRLGAELRRAAPERRVTEGRRSML